jgi:peptide/nickel transport system permease protein
MEASTTASGRVAALQSTRRTSQARRAWRFVRRWPLLPALILAVLALTGAFPGLIAPHDPYDAALRQRLAPPVWLEGGTTDNLLGIDHLGRDVLSRLIHGARVSLILAVVVVLISATVGTALGMVSGYFGGLVDDFVMRLVEIKQAVPLLLVAMIAAMVFGQSFGLLVGVLAFWSWTGFARQVRTEVLHLRTREYVLNAQLMGASTFRIFTKHLFPGVANVVVVLATLLVGSLILTESVLSFLGAGVPPPRPAWGSMIAEGREFLTNAWWIATFPGVAIFLTVVAFNFLGDWLRDYWDPRLRQTRL